jgi:kynurenine formamidase
MTHAFGPDFPVLDPPVLPPEIDHFATVPTHGFNANKLTIDEHTGTHMDVHHTSTTPLVSPTRSHPTSSSHR